jgi:hypothetical protein
MRIFSLMMANLRNNEGGLKSDNLTPLRYWGKLSQVACPNLHISDRARLRIYVSCCLLWAFLQKFIDVLKRFEGRDYVPVAICTGETPQCLVGDVKQTREKHKREASPLWNNLPDSSLQSYPIISLRYSLCGLVKLYVGLLLGDRMDWQREPRLRNHTDKGSSSLLLSFLRTWGCKQPCRHSGDTKMSKMQSHPEGTHDLEGEGWARQKLLFKKI